jgi:hypothetical protein
MEKFIGLWKFNLRGFSSDSSNQAKLNLNLPKAKIFSHIAVKNCESKTFPADLITVAVKRRQKSMWSLEKGHILPVIIVEGVVTAVPKTLQQILSRHPFPINQGPIVLPLDTNTEAKKSAHEVLVDKTMFSHSDTQECGKWAPVVFGSACWTSPQSKGNCEVKNTDMTIHGVSSTMDMSVVYPCHLAGCIIECPCHICQVPSVCCKSRHESELCKKCDSQCPAHQINVPYMFDASTDLYTMITERMGEYRHAVGYAGIPSSCKHCSADVLEHQVLHLTHHQLCRYCRFESRPLEQFNGRKSLTKFRKAELMIHWRDNLTCSVCVIEFKDKYTREQHEAVIHRHEVQKFKCDLCTKSYASKFSLDYHVKTHEKTTERPACELCGKTFTTLGSLSRHKKIAHKTDVITPEIYSCSLCEKKYSLKSHLTRHAREQHYDKKLNIDFKEGVLLTKMHECEQCDQKFKRKENLNRHHETSHSENRQIYDCKHCGNSFSREDSLKRHVKSKHV